MAVNTYIVQTFGNVNRYVCVTYVNTDEEVLSLLLNYSEQTEIFRVDSYFIIIIIIRVLVSLLLEEPLSTYCPATLIFGNMAPVWTHSLFKIIPPMSFWTTPRPLVLSWTPLCYMFGPPVVFQPWDMPYPSVLFGVNLVDNISDTCLWADPARTFSVAQC